MGSDLGRRRFCHMKTLHLIPNTLGSRQALAHLPATSIEALRHCSRFIVESENAARRLLKDALPDCNPNERPTFLLNEHTDAQDLVDLLAWFRQDGDIGVITDAGAPGVADPGAQAVRIAHGAGWTVKPHIGPSSILLALMASGLNGQSFAFKGYLPRDGQRRQKVFKETRDGLQRKKETAIFMEPPYRNETAFRDILGQFPKETMFCVAVNLTLEDEWIETHSVGEWSQMDIPQLHKKPCLFLIGN